MKKSDNSPVPQKASRLRDLSTEFQQLETRLRLGGGPDKIERQHQQGKLTARERIDLLLDSGMYSQEIGLLVAYDRYEGAAPGAGVVTVVGRVEGREVVVVANDATVKAGSWPTCWSSLSGYGGSSTSNRSPGARPIIRGAIHKGNCPSNFDRASSSYWIRGWSPKG